MAKSKNRKGFSSLISEFNKVEKIIEAEKIANINKPKEEKEKGLSALICEYNKVSIMEPVRVKKDTHKRLAILKSSKFYGSTYSEMMDILIDHYEGN